MNKKALALVLGLMLNLVPVCFAMEQEPTTQVCTEEVCAVTDVTAGPESVVSDAEPVQAPEVAEVPATFAPEVQPEAEFSEEQFKILLDQIIADANKKEEEAKKAVAQAPIAE